MSIENFYNNYPPHEDLYSQVANEQERKRNFESPTKFLAERMTHYASEEVRRINDELIQKFGMPTSRENAQSFRRKLTHEASREMNTIAIGNSIMSLEETLQDKQFDLNTLVARMNNSVEGTLLEKTQLDNEINPIEILDTQTYKQMETTANNDQTYTAFFKKQGSYMPKLMRGYLNHIKVFKSPDLDGILYYWENRAQYLHKKIDSTPTLNDLAMSEIDEILKKFS